MQGPIGFIGLGIMGRPMAKNLLKAGHAVVVSNRSQAAVQELAGLGAKTADSPAAVARAAGDLIITMLPNSPDVELVALGPKGLIEGVRSGQVLADMSTISPIVSQKVGAALAEKGVKMLDAPVSGGEKGAIEGILSIMVGGEAGVFQQVLPVFQAMGKTITHLGPARRRRLHEAREPDHRGRQPDGARRGADAGGEGGARHRADAQGARAVASPGRAASTRRRRTTSRTSSSPGSRSTSTTRTSG